MFVLATSAKKGKVRSSLSGGKLLDEKKKLPFLSFGRLLPIRHVHEID